MLTFRPLIRLLWTHATTSLVEAKLTLLRQSLGKSYLIAAPMWNFGIPYPLKHYIDIVTQPGMTFRNDHDGNVEGLAKGRRAFIVAASAMPFGSVAELDGLDFQLSYLKAWLGFIGVTDVKAVRVAGTFGSEDAVAEAMSRAYADAALLADTL